MSLVGYESPPSDFAYDPRDVILYALGVGVSVQDKGAEVCLHTWA